MSFQTPSKAREHAVLALGLASSIVLALAAWAPFGDPDLAARTQLAELAGRAADGVASEWALACRADALPVAPASDMITWTNADARNAAESVPHASVASSNVDEKRSPAFEVFFAEAEQAEIAQGDAKAALTLVDEALTKSPSSAQRTRALVRAVQLAARLGDAELVRTRFAAARAALEPSAEIEGTSALVLALLAAEARLEPSVRKEACGAVLHALADNSASLPGAAPRYERSGARFERSVDPRRAAFETRIDAACGEPATTARAASKPLSSDAFQEYVRASRTSALRAALGELPASAPSDEWTLMPACGEVFAYRLTAAGALKGAFLLRADLAARIASLARERGLLDGGFVLDFQGDRKELGETVRPRLDLPGGVVSFTLRHPDPRAIGRSASRRAGLLRGGLFVLAAFSAIAALATFRALRRERRLTELRSRFVANVSHELRTPLASILLMSENLETGRVPKGHEQRYHGAVRAEALRLRRLVDDVLDFSRLERGKPFDVHIDPTDVPAWCESLELDVRENAERAGMTLAFRARDLPPNAMIDCEALRRAVLNLADNARKHSGSREIDVDVVGREGELVLVVRDHGRGIPTAQKQAVFEPFARLEEENGVAGAGLGLAIVREIVEAHDGRVIARDPDDGPGLAIEITLPLRGEPVA